MVHFQRWKEMSVAVVTLECQLINDAFIILISIGPVLPPPPAHVFKHLVPSWFYKLATLPVLILSPPLSLSHVPFRN